MAVREGCREAAGLASLMGRSPSQKPWKSHLPCGDLGRGGVGSAVRAGVLRGVRGRCAPGKQIPPASRRAPTRAGGPGRGLGEDTGKEGR